MNRLLIDILKQKGEEVQSLKSHGKSFPGERRHSPLRDFKGSLSGHDSIRLIGEIKFASPSAGTIHEISDPLLPARCYEEAGVAALSLITDRKYFRGTIGHLPILKQGVSLPVLRKDFVIDAIQIRESFHYGADAVLLIARILSGEKLKDLFQETRDLGMEALVEVHDREDLEKALACGAEIIGINNRDLHTFEIDRQRTLELAKHVPKECLLISESGIQNGLDIRRLIGSPVQAVLVGTALMSSSDPARKARELVQAGKREYGQGQDLRHHIS